MKYKDNNPEEIKKIQRVIQDIKVIADDPEPIQKAIEELAKDMAKEIEINLVNGWKLPDNLSQYALVIIKPYAIAITEPLDKYGTIGAKVFMFRGKTLENINTESLKSKFIPTFYDSVFTSALEKELL